MKKTKIIPLGTKQVTISEISTTKIYNLLQGKDSVFSLPLPEALDKVKGLVPLALDIELSELMKEELYSNDFDLLSEAFQETNPIFFKVARMFNLENILAELIKSLLTNFSRTFAESLTPVTASQYGITDMDISAAV